MINIENLTLDFVKEDKIYYYQGESYEHIEDIALKYFSDKGYKGLFSQNSYWWNLFSFLFWDEIFDVIFLARPTSNGINVSFYPDRPFYSDMPYDLFQQEDFFCNRVNKIKQKVNIIQEEGIESVLTFNYEKVEKLYNTFSDFLPKNSLFRLIHYRGEYSLEELLVITKYIKTKDILEVLLYFMNNIAENRSGFPDIMIWNDYELKFLEVKGPSDSIKKHQLDHLKLLSDSNINTGVLALNHTEKKLINLEKKISETNNTPFEHTDYSYFFKKIERSYKLNNYHARFLENLNTSVRQKNYRRKSKSKISLIKIFFWISFLPFIIFFWIAKLFYEALKKKK